MFNVERIESGKCVACGKQAELLIVESRRRGPLGRLCLTDFIRQLRIEQATAAQPKAPESAPAAEPEQ